MTKLNVRMIIFTALALLAGQAAGESQSRRSGKKEKSLGKTLAWLKSLDTNPNSAKKQPRFPTLTVEDLKTLDQVQLGGHRASDGKHVFINAAEFKYLAALPELKIANLVEVDGLTDQALVYIGKITTLTELNLGDAWVTNAGLKYLMKLKDLQTLELGWTRDVGDPGMAIIARFKKLEKLGLGGTKVTDAGLPYLRRLPALKEINLAGTQVSDRGLMSLAAIKTLTKIQINSKCKTTPRGVAAFQKARPGCVVVNK